MYASPPPLLSSVGIFLSRVYMSPTPQTPSALAGCALNLIESWWRYWRRTPGRSSLSLSLSHPRALVSRLLLIFQEHLTQVTDLPMLAQVFPKRFEVLDVRAEHPVPSAREERTAHIWKERKKAKTKKNDFPYICTSYVSYHRVQIRCHYRTRYIRTAVLALLRQQ